MNFTGKAIQLAIDNGYGNWENQKTPTGQDTGMRLIKGFPWNEEIALVDPEFWQALGRGRNWSRSLSVCHNSETSRYPKDTLQSNGSILPIWFDWCKQCGEKCIKIEKKSHMDYWHDFIDYLAAGKKSDEFFKIILEKSYDPQTQKTQTTV